MSGTDLPLEQWSALFEGAPPALLTAQERDEWLSTLDKVALASDAFFPFRDNVDRAVQVCTPCRVRTDLPLEQKLQDSCLLMSYYSHTHTTSHGSITVYTIILVCFVAQSILCLQK